MANILKYDPEIKTGLIIQPWHISQSVDAFTGVEEYDITISGSLTTTGSIQQIGEDSYFLSNVGVGTTNISERLNIQGKININDGGNSVFIGENSGINDNQTDNRNIGIGYEALKDNTEGFFNVAIGANSLQSNTSDYNTAIGTSTLSNNNIGSSNVAIGHSSLFFNTTGGGNTAVGFSTLSRNTTGFNNIALGYRALNKNTTGDNNISIGFEAGEYISNGFTSNQTSNTSIFLGNSTKPLNEGDTNQIIIGYNAIGNGSNTITLGNDNITNTYLKGDLTVPQGIYANGSLGTSGDLLTSTGTGLQWISGSDIFVTNQQLDNYVDKTSNEDVGGQKTFTDPLTMENGGMSETSFKIGNPSTNGYGFLGFNQASGGFSSANGYTSIHPSGDNELRFVFSQPSNLYKKFAFKTDLINPDTLEVRGYQMPNKDGTIALLNDFDDYVDKSTNQTVDGEKTFTQDVTIEKGIYASGSLGTSGDLLTSTGTGLQWINGSDVFVTPSDLTNYVPYTGATSNVNLGTKALTSSGLNIEADTSGGALNLRQSNSHSLWIGDPYTSIYAKLNNRLIIRFSNDNRSITLDGSLVSNITPRTFTFPDATGILALTSDFDDYIDKSTNQTIEGEKTFTQDITIEEGIYANGSLGNSGDLLTSTGTGLQWISGSDVFATNQQLGNYQLLSEKGQALGYTPLNSNSKIEEQYLPDSILGQVTYQETWNADTNTPTLPDPPPSTTKGEYYVTDVKGTQFGIDFKVGDWIISNGIEWQKVDNTDSVTSVFGRLGNIQALASDYDAFYDNYQGWDLFTNGTSRGRITSGENINFVGGTNVSLGYSSTNNTITVNSTDTNDIDYISNVTLTGNILDFTGVGNAFGGSVDLSQFIDETDTFITNLSFNTGNGILTATLNDGTTVTEDLDGRYALDNSIGNGTLTLNTSGIATGASSFSANQSSTSTFTVDVPGTNLTMGGSGNNRTVNSSTGDNVSIPIASNTDAGFLSTGDKDKLDGIELGAEVNTVDSINLQTGEVVLDADNINDTTTAHKFTSQADIDRLANTSGTNTGDQDISGISTNASDITDLQNDKVDKVVGKGLSTEDYTTNEKNKLTGIESGAEVNTVDSVNTQTGNVVLPVLEGTQYIYVQANGTDVENATELQSAYNTAKTMSPSATNRITVICGVGNYNFSSDFVMDTQYIDLVSLDGNRSIIFNGTGTISITANDVFIKGVNVTTKNFTIATNLNLLKVENCVGGDFSFGGDPTFGGSPLTASGTFTNCQGGVLAFGYFGTASGTFTNCQGGLASFGRDGTASGIFTDCRGGNDSFGAKNNSTASGTFTNCQGGNFSFGYLGTASGTFTNCQGGVLVFGSSGTASGTFIDCIGGDSSFGAISTASGTFTNCKGGDYSFGFADTASGTFTNCVGGDASFGYQDTASGTFTNCVGGDVSFGGNGGTLNGKLYYCRLTTGTFETVSSGGVTRLCIDGNNNENNQG